MPRDRVEQAVVPRELVQVEVYQSDFNAEREARERIAGEKADLLEELNKLRQSGQAIRLGHVGAGRIKVGQVRIAGKKADLLGRT